VPWKQIQNKRDCNLRCRLWRYRIEGVWERVFRLNMQRGGTRHALYSDGTIWRWVTNILAASPMAKNPPARTGYGGRVCLLMVMKIEYNHYQESNCNLLDYRHSLYRLAVLTHTHTQNSKTHTHTRNSKTHTHTQNSKTHAQTQNSKTRAHTKLKNTRAHKKLKNTRAHTKLKKHTRTHKTQKHTRAHKTQKHARAQNTKHTRAHKTQKHTRAHKTQNTRAHKTHTHTIHARTHTKHTHTHTQSWRT
jgi:hypothetical protein